MIISQCNNNSNKWSEVAQLCPTLLDPVDCSLPGSSVHGIFQARVLEWVAIFFSRGSSQPRDRTRVSRTAGRRFTVWATREAHHFLKVHNALELSWNQLPHPGCEKIIFHKTGLWCQKDWVPLHIAQSWTRLKWLSSSSSSRTKVLADLGRGEPRWSPGGTTAPKLWGFLVRLDQVLLDTRCSAGKHPPDAYFPW